MLMFEFSTFSSAEKSTTEMNGQLDGERRRRNSPGQAMKILLIVTWAMPCCAALTEFP